MDNLSTWAWVIGIPLAVLAFFTKPTPDDIVIHTLNKCATPKEKISLVYLSTISSDTRNAPDPLSALITFVSEGRVVFKESPVYSWVEVDNKVVAYAALGMYKVPTCEQLRRKQ